MPNHDPLQAQLNEKNEAEMMDIQPGDTQAAGTVDLINNLNNDCLAKIFKCLTMEDRLTAESVCKRWKKASKLAWDDIKRLDLNDLLWLNNTGDFNRNKYAIRIIRRCGRFLKELKMDSCNQWTEFNYSKLLPIISQHCSNLIKLEAHFSHCRYGLAQCLSRLNKLRSFTMNGISMESLPENIFESMPAQNLIELHLFSDTLRHLPVITPNVFVNFKNLKSMTFNFLELGLNVMEMIGEKTSLTYLSLSYCGIQEREFVHIQKLTNLEYLDLSGIAVDDDFLRELAIKCQQLKILNLDHCDHISNIGLRQLQKLMTLEELRLNYLHSITDAPLGEFGSLRKLECNGCFQVTNTGLVKLIKYATNLEHLNVSNTGVTKDFLMEAIEITRRRTNDLKLRLIISDSLKDDCFLEENYSPLLVIEQIPPKPQGCDDDGSDFDVYFDRDDDSMFDDDFDDFEDKYDAGFI